MGQKSSKKPDIYVTENVSHCDLPEDEVTGFVGRAREYTAVNVSVDEDSSTKGNTIDKKRPAPPSRSITSILNKAHRRGYRLSFIIPKLEGHTPSRLARNSFVDELPETNSSKDEKSNSAQIETTHTVFLLRPKVKSRLKQEASMKKMEAARTFLNVMMDIEQKWGFGVKEFSANRSLLENGKYVAQLQEMISKEAKKGGKLLSVMVKSDKETTTPQTNGTKSESGEENAEKKTDAKENNSSNNLTLRMVFYLNFEEDATPTHEYSVACHQTACTEQALKIKKKAPPPKSDRKTNVTWSENWLNIFQNDARLIEVINVGESNPPAQDEKDVKPKKIKSRQFQISTLCFYEKTLPKEDDKSSKPASYDGLTREVWAPINNNLQENLDDEAEKFGEHGWELCTVLITSHVRMKEDGSEFRKCLVFFQRPKRENVPANELDKSRENLLDEESKDPTGNGDVEATPSSPKDKMQKFGVALMKVDDLDRSKLKAAKTSPSRTNQQPAEAASPMPAVQLKKVDKDKQKKDTEQKDVSATLQAMSAVQLKKVDRDKPKKEEEPKDQSGVQQVKLRPTEVKPKVQASENETDKEVPWLASLEKKRKAVMESENKTQKTKSTTEIPVVAPKPVKQEKNTKLDEGTNVEQKDKEEKTPSGEPEKQDSEAQQVTDDTVQDEKSLDLDSKPDLVLQEADESAPEPKVEDETLPEAPVPPPEEQPAQAVEEPLPPPDVVPQTPEGELPPEHQVAPEEEEALKPSERPSAVPNEPAEPLPSPPAEPRPLPEEKTTDELLPPPSDAIATGADKQLPSDAADLPAPEPLEATSDAENLTPPSVESLPPPPTPDESPPDQSLPDLPPIEGLPADASPSASTEPLPPPLVESVSKEPDSEEQLLPLVPPAKEPTDSVPILTADEPLPPVEVVPAPLPPETDEPHPVETFPTPPPPEADEPPLPSTESLPTPPPPNLEMIPGVSVLQPDEPLLEPPPPPTSEPPPPTTSEPPPPTTSDPPPTESPVPPAEPLPTPPTTDEPSGDLLSVENEPNESTPADASSLPQPESLVDEPSDPPVEPLPLSFDEHAPTPDTTSNLPIEPPISVDDLPPPPPPGPSSAEEDPTQMETISQPSPPPPAEVDPSTENQSEPVLEENSSETTIEKSRKPDVENNACDNAASDNSSPDVNAVQADGSE